MPRAAHERFVVVSFVSFIDTPAVPCSLSKSVPIYIAPQKGGFRPVNRNNLGDKSRPNYSVLVQLLF